MSEKASLEANKAYINSKSDKVLYDKFCKDFNNVCYNNDINPNNEQTKITCTQMSGLFLQLGFARVHSSDNEQLFLAQIWKIIGGHPDGDGEVYLHNAKVIMCSIQNFHIDWMIDNERDETDSNASPSRKIGRFENGYLMLTPDEISRITKKYISMYRNRQAFIANNQKKSHKFKSLKNGNMGEKYKYSPDVSLKNKKLAK